MGNLDTEKKAIDLLEQYEALNGNKVLRVKNKGYDLECAGKKIEVKSRSKYESKVILICEPNILACEKSGDEWNLYVVTGVNDEDGNVELIKFSKKELMGRIREMRTWRLTLKNSDFEKAISLKQFLRKG